MLIGLPFLILSESLNPGPYPKLLLLHAGIAMLAVLALRGLAQPATHPLLLPLIAAIALHLLSTTQSVNRVESLIVISHRVALLSACILGVALIDRRHIVLLFQTIGTASTIVSLIGIAQYSGVAGLNLPSTGMPSATLGYRNFAAAFVIVSLPILIAELIRSPRDFARIAWAVALALNGTFLLTTRSRAAWGACVLSGLVFLGLVIWKTRADKQTIQFSKWRPVALKLAFSITVAVLFSLCIPPQMGEAGYETHSTEKTSLAGAISSTFDKGSDKHRFTMWKNTLEMVIDYPVLGVGPGNWQHVYPVYDRGTVSWTGATPKRPHNDTLWIASETGLVGLAMLIWAGLTVIASLGRSVRTERDRTAFLQVVGAFSALVAVAAHGLFSFPIERIPVTFVSAVAITVIVLRDPVSRQKSNTDLRPHFWGLLILTQLLATVTLWRGVTFERHAFRQNVAVHSNDWIESIKEGSLALAQGAFDPQVYLLRGLAYHITGQYDLAIKDQSACLALHPNLVNAINNMGMSLNAAGRYDQAVQTLERILELNPNHVEQHLNLSQAFKGLSNREESLRQLELAIQKAPRRQEIVLELARKLEKAGELKKASSVVTKGLRNRPEDSGLHYRLGVILQKQGAKDQAASSFATVIQLNPMHAPVYYNIGELRLAAGDTSGAIQAYQGFLSRWTEGDNVAAAVRSKIEQLQ